MNVDLKCACGAEIRIEGGDVWTQQTTREMWERMHTGHGAAVTITPVHRVGEETR